MRCSLGRKETSFSLQKSGKITEETDKLNMGRKKSGSEVQNYTLKKGPQKQADINYDAFFFFHFQKGILF